MNKINEGGLAFPCTNTLTNGTIFFHPGMTLRDYFAAKAMQGFAAHLKGAELKRGETGPQANARLAYQYADAMIAERERGK